MSNIDKPIFYHDRFVIRMATLTDDQKLLNYRLKNKRHLAPFEPKRDISHYQLISVQLYLAEIEKTMTSKKSLNFLIIDSHKDIVIGVINFSNIIPQPFNACYLGYSLDKDHQGQGIMTQALKVSIDYMFYEKKLHRIMVNYMPNNERSRAVLERLGFEKEGYAKSYLEINGEWADHVLTAKTNHQLLP